MVSNLGLPLCHFQLIDTTSKAAKPLLDQCYTLSVIQLPHQTQAPYIKPKYALGYGCTCQPLCP